LEKIKKTFLLFTLFSLSLIVGFVRENTFVTINYRLGDLYRNDFRIELPNWLKFLEPLNYSELYYFKWFLTVLFASVFLLLSVKIVNTFFESSKYQKITIVIFTSIFIISFLGFAVGLMIRNINKGYTFSRFFMGLLQSPFIIIFIISALKLLERNKIENKEI
jgi:quinol-cytochrome oxidoreductase complex cytochrome b subunit